VTQLLYMFIVYTIQMIEIHGKVIRYAFCNNL